MSFSSMQVVYMRSVNSLNHEPIPAGGVIIVVLSIVVVITWYHQRANKSPATNAQPDCPPVPPNTNQYGAVLPTTGSGDPFHIPMVQHQNLGVSHLNSTPTPSSPVTTAPSGTISDAGPSHVSHYTGLPELQQNPMSGSPSLTPIPQHDSSRPHQLPIARPWSGFAAQPSGVNQVRYAEGNSSQPSGWGNPTDGKWESLPRTRNASPQYAGRSSSDGAAGRL
ncbi:hypothetical protein FRC08_014634 [Ceratobasidium sp. 394]|nr:hypothetical protein FRC08_014634 [Ceratobasidium sp. 394]